MSKVILLSEELGRQDDKESAIFMSKLSHWIWVSSLTVESVSTFATEFCFCAIDTKWIFKQYVYCIELVFYISLIYGNLML